MCWCTPTIRTPVCNKPGCHPPGSQAEKPDWQVRVIEEKANLDAKIEKLQIFFGTGDYARLRDPDRDLLREQKRHMLAYSGVLDRRISRFKFAQP